MDWEFILKRKFSWLHLKEKEEEKNVEILKTISGVTTHPCFAIFSILSGLMNNARKLQKHYVVTRTPGDINSLRALLLVSFFLVSFSLYHCYVSEKCLLL